MQSPASGQNAVFPSAIPNDHLAAALLAVSSSLDRNSILERTCQAAVDLLGVSHSGLVLFDDDLQHGTVRAEWPAIGAHGQRIRLEGNPVEQALLLTGQPQVIEDVKNADHLGEVRGILLGLGIQSTLLVPVQGQSRMLGSFSLDTIGHTHSFSEQAIRISKLLAAQVAIAVENAQQFEQARLRAEQLATLHRISVAVTSPLNQGALWQLILQSAVALLRARSAGLYELRQARGDLKLIADYNRQDNVGSILRVGEGMAGRLVQSGASHLAVTDYNQWEYRSAQYCDGRFGAVLEVPLLWKDECIGVLYVDDEPGRQFTPDDIQTLGMFAEQAVVALGNARLLAQDAAMLQRLEQLSKATREIMANLRTTPLDDRLKLIARHAAEILRAEACGVFLVNRPGYLSLEANYGEAPGSFVKGAEFPIRSGPKSGLTGHIAAQGRIFNAYGAELTDHFAVTGNSPHHVASGQCYSLLAIPLRQTGVDGDQTIGLVRVDNKLDEETGQPLAVNRFTREDEWVLSIFAETIAVAIEGAAVVRELAEQQDQLQRLIAASPSGIVANDTHGKVIAFNERAQQMLGYPLDAILGTQVRDLFWDPAEAHRLGDLVAASDTGRISDHETFARHKNQDQVPIRLSVTRLYAAGGEWNGTVGYFEDLTAKYQARQRLELLFQASNAVARASDLTGGLAELARLMVDKLGHSFCRILITDETQTALIVQAAYPIQRLTRELLWTPGLAQRVTIEAWPRLPAVIAAGQAVVRHWAEAADRAELDWLTRALGLEANIQSLLLVPLISNAEVVGLFTLGELRSEERRPLGVETVELVTAIADQTTVLIDKQRLAAATQRREELLSALDEASRHIRADKSQASLMHEIVRLAVELLEGQAGLLYLNREHLKELEVAKTFGLEPNLEGSLSTHQEGVAGLVARTGEAVILNDYEAWPQREAILAPYDFANVLAAPFKLAGSVEAVLVIASQTHTRRFAQMDKDILKRFARHGAIALQTSNLINREQRTYQWLNILQKIGDYAQTHPDLDKVLHVTLTGITAGYGLGFNRAAVFLLDPVRRCLVGRCGIGGLEEAAIREDWQTHSNSPLTDFEHYLLQLDEGALQPTLIGERIQGLTLPLVTLGSTVFEQALNSQQYQMLERTEQLQRLPLAFRDKFQPAAPFIVVPLVSRQQVLGLLVADNKVTHAPVDREQVENLLRFADTASLAVDNLGLLDATRLAEERLRMLYQASNLLTSASDPDQLLAGCVARVRQAAGADQVSMVLLDDECHIRQMISDGNAAMEDPFPTDKVRANGLSMQVMQSQRAAVIEDTEAEIARVHPDLFKRGIRATLGLPVSTAGKSIGVMWLNFSSPRPFPDDLISGLQLYVNQATIAFESARTIKELVYMRGAARALAAASNVTEVLDLTVMAARDVLQAQSAFVWSYDEARQAFNLDESVAAGIENETWDKFRKEGPRAHGTAAEVRRLGWLAVTDINDRERYAYVGDRTRGLLIQTGARSFQAIPLQTEGEHLGVLYMNYDRRRSFTAEERATAESLGYHAALAIRQVRLMEHLDRSTKTAGVVARLLAQGNMRTAIKAIADETMTLLGCDAVVVYDYLEATGKVVSPATMVGVRWPELAQQRSEVEPDSIVYAMISKDDIYIVADTALDPLFRNRRFVRDESIKSVLAVPLKHGESEERVGVMFLNYRSPHTFIERELDNVRLLADQAATAINSAGVLQAEQRRAASFYEMAKLSIAISDTLDLDKVLQQACRAAQGLFKVGHSGIVWFDDDLESGRVVAEYPDMGLIGERIQLRGVPAQERLIESRLHQKFYDVALAEDLAPVRDILLKVGTRSLLIVPIVVKGRLVGSFGLDVIGERKDFSQEEIVMTNVFASQLAVAHEYARLYKEATDRLAELERTKTSLTSSLALAHMGMSNTVWRHTLDGHAINIRNAIFLMRLDVAGDHLSQTLNDIISRHLDVIESEAGHILDKPVTPPLSSEEGVEVILLNDLIKERVTQLLSRSQYSAALPEVVFQLDLSHPTVSVSPEWLRRAFDIVFENAFRALAGRSVRQITISTWAEKGCARLAIKDTGGGIAPEVLPHILDTRIPKRSGETGHGLGLLMAKLIMETYEGRIELTETGLSGTTFTLELPLVA